MTYKGLIEIIKRLANDCEYINQIIDFDPYAANTMSDIKYATFAWSANNITEDGSIMSFGLNLFVFDRLDEKMSNKLEIQSAAISILKNILDRLQDEYDIPCENRTYTTFYEQFKDMCAGAYCNVQFNIEVGDCYE